MWCLFAKIIYQILFSFWLLFAKVVEQWDLRSTRGRPERVQQTKGGQNELELLYNYFGFSSAGALPVPAIKITLDFDFYYCFISRKAY